MAKILQGSAANAPQTGRIWNIGRDNHLRANGQPIILKWGDTTVALPAKGESTSVDTGGRPISVRAAYHLAIHHEGVSNVPPVRMTVAAETQPTLAQLQQLGGVVPVPVLEEVDVDESPDNSEGVAVEETPATLKSTSKKKG